METKFNFNSQICTTREQSERLLALGLKKETADMVWLDHAMTEEYDDWKVTPVEEWDDWNEHDIPAWSLHRLIEMAFNSLKDADADDEDEIYFVRKVNPFESMLELFEWLIKEGYFNKEYLNHEN